ncbi:Hypothetical protein SRAE_1000188000 [Strongyloides ratti]|uniref:Uncharacterized protein n=1 Tax=Strongyloides ratti TaxID=34506 RepID=A0A090L7Y5_STRRB|nr:Hypothetical protein SRAE_1000188000 [Strongyloides ratti]CEF63620.1 Hypothetical protein SRAE_1000188000 [Strongyloides ratti]
MYLFKYQSFCIFLICLQFPIIIVGDYNGYRASLPRDNLPQNTHPFIKPYYHSINDYENQNYNYWYENKPLPHYHGNVPITIHQHYTQEEHFIDDETYVTDPPGFSLTKYKQENLQKLSINKNNNYSSTKIDKSQLPKARLSGSESFDGKDTTPQQIIDRNKLTKSEEKLLKEIEEEIAMEEEKKGKSVNSIVNDISKGNNKPENNMNEITKEKSTNKIVDDITTNEEYKKIKSENNINAGTQDKSTNLVVEDITDDGLKRDKGKVTTDLIGTSISTIKSAEKFDGFAKYPPGTQPDPFSHLPKVSTSANTYTENGDKKESKYKTTFGNEVNINEPDNDKNQGSDYMDDLDKMSTGEKRPTTSTPKKYISKEKAGNDYDLISYDNKKTSYGEEENADFFTDETKKPKTKMQLEKQKHFEEEKKEYETTYTSSKKTSDKLKCCPCCGPSTLSPNILLPTTLSPRISPKYEFTQLISNPQIPVQSSILQSSYASSYIPTGAELAARYGVPYPSMVSQGKSCGSPSIPCIQIPYIPPPCCITPPPPCCLPTIPCCPKINISCCPQSAICCEPNQNQYQQPRTSCNSCKSKTIMKYRSKRNTCLPCKYNKRSKRSDFFKTINPDIDQHLRVKRFGCIPCLHRRVKRTPLKSNCQTCSGNGNIRAKRSINCTLCTAGKLTIPSRSKRDTIYDSPGYDNIFNCDKSCCDYSRCNELSAKPLQSKKKNLN